MSKNSLREYRKLCAFIGPHLGLLILASVCMVVSTFFGGVTLGMIVPVADKILANKQIVIPHSVPPFLSNFIAHVNAMDQFQVLKIVTVGIFVAFLLKGVFIFLQGYFMNMVGLRAVRDVRNRIFQKLQYLPLGFYSQARTGELISRITNDAALINNAISYGLTDFIYQTMQIVFFTFVIFYIHWKLAIIIFVVFPAVVYPVMRIGKKIKQLTRKTQEKMADINTILSESIQGIKLIKAFGTEEYEVARFVKTNYHHYKFTMKSFKRFLMLSPFGEFISAVAGVVVLWIAGREVIEGTLSFGVFGLFMASLMSMISPFKKLTNTYSIFQQALSGSERIYQILDLPAEKELFAQPGKIPVPLDAIRDGVIFHDVWFQYPHTDAYVLKEVNFQVRKNQIIALVGESGAGKTTVINLLMRFYDPGKGEILIDGKDIRDFELSSLRKHMGIVPQETILFNDTIEANIAYGASGATERQVREAARQALCEEFILNLPEGYQTRIGDRGMKLSGGERQRIAIARVILRNPPILILDEATSSLDNKSEHLIQEALKRVIYNKTVFVIAHRLSTIKQATKIIVLEKGSLKETGTHEELLRDSVIYKRLYELQLAR